MKIAIYPVLAIVGAGVAAMVSLDYKFAAALMAAASTALGFSPAWYFTGIRKPSAVLLTDGLPRLITTGVAALLLGTVNAPLFTYPLLFAFAGVASPWFGFWAGGIKPRTVQRLSLRRQALLVKIQLTALRGRIAVTLYRSLPVLLVGLVAPNVVPVFAAAERLQKMTQQFLNSINLYLTSWAGSEAQRKDRLTRANRAIVIGGLMGISAGVVFAILAPLASRILFQGAATFGFVLASTAGVVIALSCVARALVIRLVAQQHLRNYSNAAWASAITGVVSVTVFAPLGAVAAMAGEVIAEATAAIYQWVSSQRAAKAHTSQQPRIIK